MLNSYALRSFEEKNESAAAPHSHGKWRAMLHNERISDFVSLSKYAVAFFGRRFLLSLDSSRFNRLISHPAAEPQQPDILVQGSALVYPVPLASNSGNESVQIWGPFSLMWIQVKL